MITGELAEAAVVDVLGMLDAEAWDDLARHLDPDAELADELTGAWLRGQDRVSKYLRAQAGVVTEIASSPADMSVQAIGDDHAFVTFALRQSYALDGQALRQTMTGCMLFRFDGDVPMLRVLHFGLADDSATGQDGDEPPRPRSQAAEGPSPAPTLGDELRRRRAATGLTLRGLAERTGLSASFLSQVERSIADPSVGSLRRIASGLGISVTALLAEEAHGQHGYRSVASSELTSIYLADAGITIDAFPAPPGSQLRAYIASADDPPAARERVLPHEAFVYVLDGAVEFAAGDSGVTLEPGDGLHVAADVAHTLEPRAGVPARYLTVQAPVARRRPGGDPR